MKLPIPTCSRRNRMPADTRSTVGASGQVLAELGCWVLGIAMLVAYLAATSSLENQRKQGVERFAEAREAQLGSHRLEDLPMASQILSDQSASANGETLAPTHTPDVSSLPIAVLRMAGVGLEVPVYPDISELNLSRGAGWIEGTAAPNTVGNMAMAAHRDQYFRPLKDVQVGDLLVLESLSGHGEYRVSRIWIVDPDEVSVLDDTDLPTVTLVTCYPFYFIGNAPQRYIVQATVVEQFGKASASDALLSAPPSGETL